MAIGRIPEPGTGIPESIVDAKGDIVTATAADTPARLAVGSNEQRLVADSAAATGLKYVADTTNYAIAAKGDLLVGTGADTLAALTVGTNGHTLVADSSTSTGLKWAAPASGLTFVGCSVKRTDVSTVITANATYVIAFNTEEYDSDGFHDNSTNNSRITIPSGKGGKYLMTGYVGQINTVGSYFELGIRKNGSAYTDSGLREGRVFRNTPKEYLSIAQVVNAAAGDYFELTYQQEQNVTANMWFSCQFAYLGA